MAKKDEKKLKLTKEQEDFVDNFFVDENIKLAKDVVTKSDDVVIKIYKFINETIDDPSKNQITIYRKTLLRILDKNNDEKYKYLYAIIAKSVYEYRETEFKQRDVLTNQVLVNPTFLTISWNELQKNIQDKLGSRKDGLTVKSIKDAYMLEHERLNDLYQKINQMIESGIEIPKDKVNITKKTFLKLSELVNIFMLENFDEVDALVQEIEIFEKRYSLSTETNNSVYMDANYKNISNLAMPVRNDDAANKKYVDDQIAKIYQLIN